MKKGGRRRKGKRGKKIGGEREGIGGRSGTVRRVVGKREIEEGREEETKRKRKEEGGKPLLKLQQEERDRKAE